MQSPVRIFVGSVHSHRLMVQVLAWSIRRHGGGVRAIEIESIGELLNGALPMPKDPANLPATPFSFQRFAVPSLAAHRGRAIYMDADQLALGNVAELFDRHLWGASLQCRRTGGPDGARNRNRSSVMLLDCARLEWEPQQIANDLDSGRYGYRELMSLKFQRLKGCFPRQWNSLDLFEPGRTRLLHYTQRPTQPWVSGRHPHARLWFEALFSGLDARAVTTDVVDEALAQGYCRPSIRWQVNKREPDPRAVPKSFHDADQAFFAYCEKNQFNNLDGDYRDN